MFTEKPVSSYALAKSCGLLPTPWKHRLETVAIFQNITKRKNCLFPVTIGFVVMVSKRNIYKELLSQHFWCHALVKASCKEPIDTICTGSFKMWSLFLPALSRNYNLRTRYIWKVFPYWLIYCAIMNRIRSRCYDSMIFHWYYRLLVRGRDVPKKVEGTRHICIFKYNRSVWY